MNAHSDPAPYLPHVNHHSVFVKLGAKYSLRFLVKVADITNRSDSFPEWIVRILDQIEQEIKP